HQLAGRRLAGVELGARPEALPEVPRDAVLARPARVAERLLRRLEPARPRAHRAARARPRARTLARLARRRLRAAGAGVDPEGARARSAARTAVGCVCPLDAAPLRPLRRRVDRARGSLPGVAVPGRVPHRRDVLASPAAAARRGRPVAALACLS